MVTLQVDGARCEVCGRLLFGIQVESDNLKPGFRFYCDPCRADPVRGRRKRRLEGLAVAVIALAFLVLVGMPWLLPLLRP